MNVVNLNKGFAGLAIFALSLGLLYWLQPVLLPLVLAILLTFLLSPVVNLLQRRRVPRVPAVVLVVVLVGSLLTGAGWLMARQLGSLVDAFPQYEQNLDAKIDAMQSDGSGFLDKLQIIVKRISRRAERQSPARAHAEAAAAAASSPTQSALPVRVVADETPFHLSDFWTVLAPVLQPFATIGLAVVLLIFMLIRREDLRDRLISLAGHRQVALTTRALDEAGVRVSRYLLTQAIINGSYGALVAAGLLLIGVPYALLWGFFAALLRYIPYLGPWLAALLPIGLSLLVAQGWTAPLLVIGLFLVLESITNMVAEPWLYGRGIGVSATATLVMIAFWTWLWGPIGLVLATPLTVCLVVASKYVPALAFFDTLLGDKPALEASMGFYQRLLARDEDEAAEIAQTHLEEHSLASTFDELLLPALSRSKQDLERAAITADEHETNLGAVGTISEQIISAHTKAAAAPADRPLPEARIAILGLCARDDADETALLMLQSLLDPTLFDFRASGAALLASEATALVEETRPAIVCIAAVPPGGSARARLLCLRLHGQFPKLPILVGRWGTSGDATKAREQLQAAGASDMAKSLQETCRQIESLRQLRAAAAAVEFPSSRTVETPSFSAP